MVKWWKPKYVKTMVSINSNTCKRKGLLDYWVRLIWSKWKKEKRKSLSSHGTCVIHELFIIRWEQGIDMSTKKDKTLTRGWKETNGFLLVGRSWFSFQLRSFGRTDRTVSTLLGEGEVSYWNRSFTYGTHRVHNVLTMTNTFTPINTDVYVSETSVTQDN